MRLSFRNLAVPLAAYLSLSTSASHAQGLPGIQQACEQALAGFNAALFSGSSATCAEFKPAFCERLRHLNLEEYQNVAEQIEAGRQMRPYLADSGLATMEDAIADCGLRVDGLAAQACDQAVRQNEYHFVAANCPAQTSNLIAAHCAGRDYSSLQRSSDKDLCDSLGFTPPPNTRTASTVSSNSAEAANPEPLIHEGMQLMESLLGL